MLHSVLNCAVFEFALALYVKNLGTVLSGRGVLAAAVPAVGQGRRCRGWAKLLLEDAAAAAALLVSSCTDSSALS